MDNQEDIHKLLVWKHLPPTDQIELRKYEDNMKCADRFIIDSLPDFPDDEPGALVYSCRGWTLPFSQESRDLVQLFRWSSPEAEARCKDPTQSTSNDGAQTLSYYDKLYEDCFRTAITNLERKGWLYNRKNLHVYLSSWTADASN